MVLSPKEYIEQNSGSWVLADPEFNGRYTILSSSTKTSDHLDGFMSNIFMCEVILEKIDNEEKRTVSLVVKVMKGTEKFRTDSKSFLQCGNEIYIYEKVIPYFKEFVKSRKSFIDIEEWTPKLYHLFYGQIPEVSEMDESVLAMENVSVNGFKGGPRLELDLSHLTLMIKKIAQYHAVQYAMRIEKDPMLETLKNGLNKLNWKDPSGSTDNVYEIIYRACFDRMFEYLDRNPEMYNSSQMKEEVGLLREKYGKDPVAFLELFNADDKAYSVIQHGDYNRNNVLFKYCTEDPDKPIALRMIDFQETRYGSPAFDLFFFFYMSTTAEFRKKHWDDLLRLYHSEIWQNLKDLLKCGDEDERLDQYSYDGFQKHFARFAFYGTTVVISFLPWMDSDPEQLAPLASEFTNNMRSEKFKTQLMSVGGDSSNKKIAEALQHACERGYLSFIKDL